MKYTASMDRDSNFTPLTGDYPFRTKRTITFAGGTTNGWGDDGGTLDGGAIFTVTGVVQVKMLGVCTTDLDGGATEEVGISGATNIFCSQITDTALAAPELWLHDAIPVEYFIVGEEQAAADNFPEYVLNGQDIILTTTTTNTTSGVVDFYAFWRPISDNASIVATTT